MIVGTVIKLFTNKNTGISRSEFEKHKDSVQYKDNCQEVVKRIETSISAVAEVQGQQIEGLEKKFDSGFGELKDLIKNVAS